MNKQKQIIVVAYNMRSCHNVGSLLRTAEGLGIKKVVLAGYTPYPAKINDERLPHIIRDQSKKISKTALGAESTIDWEYKKDISSVIEKFKQSKFQICALEQSPKSIKLPEFEPSDKIVIILGPEVEGLDQAVLQMCDTHLEIPMFGKKESFNVVQAAAMAMYHCTFYA